MNTTIAMQDTSPQFESPMNSLAKMMQLQQAQQQNQLGQMKMDEYRTGQERTNGLRALLNGDYANPQARQDAMMKGGYLKEAQDYGKNQAEIEKTTGEAQFKQLETAHKKIDIMGQVFGFVKDNPSTESAMQATDYLVQNGIMTPEQAQATKAKIAADPSPETIRTLATQAYQSALSTKDQLPKLQTFNAGNRQVTQSVNPITGKATETGSTGIMQSPDSIASNATQRRGQNMTDSRAREGQAQSASQHAATLAAGFSKPFEVTGPDGLPALVRQDKAGNITPVTGYSPKSAADKPLTDAQSKAALFGSRMQASNEVLASLENDGTTTSIPGARAGFGIGSVLNTVSTAKQQQLNQAKRDFVNAVLRRESGAVIADSEFSNAEQQYFPQVGDSKEVIRQKSNNRALAIRGIQAEVPKAQRGVLKEIQGGSIDSLLDKYK